MQQTEKGSSGERKLRCGARRKQTVLQRNMSIITRVTVIRDV
jgi:hypothetical protein